MEKMTNDELPSTNNELYDKLIAESEKVLVAMINQMPNAQLIDFYDYVVEKSDDTEGPYCDKYWLAALYLEELPVIRMYKNGQLYSGDTLDDDAEMVQLDDVLSEEEAQQIEEIVQLLNKRKKEKHSFVANVKRYVLGK